MLRITPDRSWLLFDAAGLRGLEQLAAASLPPHTLMQRAGLATARLALALAPHARTFWVACGPGNNGGDGLEAAMHLRQWGKDPIVTWAGTDGTAPADAKASLLRARAAGVRFGDAPPAGFDFALDALLGIGAARPLQGPMEPWARHLAEHRARVLAVDIPSGMDAGTGHGAAVQAAHTISLLGLKTGLFTGGGRDASGQVWLDDLGVGADAGLARAELLGPLSDPVRPHASHKGSYGDVAVVGGAPGMGGAALLAASAALHAGAGRVFVGLLDEAGPHVDPAQPELMLRAWVSLDVSALAVACGCGGGDAVRLALPRLLSSAPALVLDADALNAIAGDSQLQALLAARGRRAWRTVLTPHPLEAARLLESDTAAVQSDRLSSAESLSSRFGATVVLKGSGTVIAAAGRRTAVNPTGNARLATAGTGDVLAGMVAARLAQGDEAFDAACAAVYRHGAAADAWPAQTPLTAGALARAG
jgi:hydroxyethylthiazole kinase-like uncharacterized protein yjeF